MNLTRREVKGRYTQSLFGIGWAIAQPLATMAVFTLVFSRLGKIPSGGVAVSFALRHTSGQKSSASKRSCNAPRASEFAMCSAPAARAAVASA